MGTLNKKALVGLKWSALERLLTQSIQLLVMLMLARILGPETFGLVGMLSILIVVSNVLVDSGLSSALIREQSRSESDYATVFYASLTFSIVCYLILYFSAEPISNFYSQPKLESLVKVLAITIIIDSVTIVHKAKLSIELDFRTQAKVSLISVTLSGFMGILFANYGFGVWSLVVQNISSSFFSMFILNCIVPWRPKFQFNMESFSRLFKFGYKLLLADLINAIYQNIYQLLIGKVFDAKSVGIFTQSNQISRMPSVALTMIVQKVTFPYFSKLQHDKGLNKLYFIVIKLTASLVFPTLIGLSILSDNLVSLVLGDVWQESSALISIISIGMMLYPIHAINLNYLKVKGRSDIILRAEIIKKIIMTIILIITIRFGVFGICLGMMIQSYISLFINIYYSASVGSLTLREQLLPLTSIWVASIFSFILGKEFSLWFTNDDVFVVISTLFVSLPIYIMVVLIFNRDLYSILRNFLSSKKGSVYD
ncbi:lipopolysaccharide biosynthesis protein [Vibrio sp. TRT 17S01]|uniref:lipopolysaccharide biosynthesis protein n=1 Tax=Vibrio sp. TRT 17S01 TaxID=3418505 RepID=UPI003CE916A0